MRVQLGRAAGDVDGRDRRSRPARARQCSIVSRVMISVRSGPASTWQWRQVWLQSLPTLIWKISMPVGRSGQSPARRQRLVETPGRAGAVAASASCVAGDGERSSAAQRGWGACRGPSHIPSFRRGCASGRRAPARRRRGSPRRRAPPRSSGRGPRPSRARPCCRRRCSTGTAPRARPPARSATSRARVSAPSAKTAPYQSKNFFASSRRFSPISGNR